MVRFRLVTAFLVVALIGVWLATGQLDWTAGADIRRAIWCIVFIVPVLAVIHFRRTRRAFWLGFLLPLVAFAFSEHFRFGPKLGIAGNIASLLVDTDQEQNYAVYFLVNDTIQLILLLAMCCLTGWISASIYQQARADDNSS